MQGRNRLHTSYATVVDLGKTPIFIIGCLIVLDVLIIKMFWRDVNADLVNSYIPW